MLFVFASKEMLNDKYIYFIVHHVICILTRYLYSPFLILIIEN